MQTTKIVMRFIAPATKGLFVVMFFLFTAFMPKTSNIDGDDTMMGSHMKACRTLVAVLPDFDFDAKCEVVSFELMYMQKNEDPLIIQNKGHVFQKETLEAVQHAKAGDCYVFTKIKAKCPGDEIGRTIESLTIRIR